ncbi:MAG: hypothetical protein EXR85_02075 [Xanthomonadales bacterium]|nr:hypothetical protein [Xanthomonadales bacterium]
MLDAWACAFSRCREWRPGSKTLDATAADSPSPAVIAARDLLLSDGLLLYIQHRRYGKVSPATRNWLRGEGGRR